MRSFSIRTPASRVVTPLAALAILLLLAWYFVQPLDFPALAQRDVETVRVVTVRILPPETFADAPRSDMQRHVFPAGSPEVEALQHVLDFSAYHRSWGTLTDAGKIGGGGECIVTIIGCDGEDRVVFDMTLTGGKDIFVNGRAYQVGWWGGGSGERLTEDLAGALGTI